MRSIARVILILGLLVSACALHTSVPVLFAASVPTTKHAVFTQTDLVTANVVSFIVKVNGVTQTVPAPAVACVGTVCTVPITLTAFGPQTVTVAPQNQDCSGAPCDPAWPLTTGPALTYPSWSLSPDANAPTLGKITN